MKLMKNDTAFREGKAFLTTTLYVELQLQLD